MASSSILFLFIFSGSLLGSDDFVLVESLDVNGAYSQISIKFATLQREPG